MYRRSVHGEEVDSWSVVANKRSKSWADYGKLVKVLDDIFRTCREENDLEHILTILQYLEDAAQELRKLADQTHHLLYPDSGGTSKPPQADLSDTAQSTCPTALEEWHRSGGGPSSCMMDKTLDQVQPPRGLCHSIEEKPPGAHRVNKEELMEKDKEVLASDTVDDQEARDQQVDEGSLCIGELDHSCTAHAPPCPEEPEAHCPEELPLICFGTLSVPHTETLPHFKGAGSSADIDMRDIREEVMLEGDGETAEAGSTLGANSFVQQHSRNLDQSRVDGQGHHFDQNLDKDQEKGPGTSTDVAIEDGILSHCRLRSDHGSGSDIDSENTTGPSCTSKQFDSAIRVPSAHVVDDVVPQGNAIDEGQSGANDYPVRVSASPHPDCKESSTSSSSSSTRVDGLVDDPPSSTEKSPATRSVHWQDMYSDGTALVVAWDNQDSTPKKLSSRLLQEKLMSPDRRRKSPLETKRAAEAKQAKAEQLRGQLVEERLSRLARANHGREVARSLKGGQAEALMQRVSSRHQRSAQLRQAHLTSIMMKAGDETQKVQEIAFINKLTGEEKLMSLKQKLEEGEARRHQHLTAILARQQEVQAAVEEVQERKKMKEERRRQQLEEKHRKKEAAQVKLEEERRAAALLREVQKEQQRWVMEQLQAAREEEAARRSARIAQRLNEAAKRRLEHLEVIRERAALGNAPERRDSWTPAATASRTSRGGTPIKKAVGVSSPSPGPRSGSEGPGAGQEVARARWAAGLPSSLTTTTTHSQKQQLRTMRKKASKLAKSMAEARCEFDASEAVRVQELSALSSSTASSFEHCLEELSARVGRSSGSDRLGALRELVGHVERHWWSPGSERWQVSCVCRKVGFVRFLGLEVAQANSNQGVRKRKKEVDSLLRRMTNLLVVMLQDDEDNIVYLLVNNLTAGIMRGVVRCLHHQCSLLGEEAHDSQETGQRPSSSQGRVVSSKSPLRNASENGLTHHCEGPTEISGAPLSPPTEVDSLSPHVAELLQVLIIILRYQPTTPQLQRICQDLVGYGIACGLVHRIGEVLSLFDRPVAEASAPVPCLVELCLQLMREMAGRYCSRAPERKLSGCMGEPWSSGPHTILFKALGETAMAGTLSLLVALLLQAAPSCTPGEAKPGALPANFVAIALCVMELLNHLMLLDHQATQQLLVQPHNRLELFHLLGFLISYCTEHWPRRVGSAGDRQPGGTSAADSCTRRESPCAAPSGSDPVVHLFNEVILLLGYFTLMHGSNQGVLLWGKGPRIIDRLCGAPLEYFCQPRFREVLMPTIISGAYMADRVCESLEQYMSLEIVVDFITDHLPGPEGAGDGAQLQECGGLAPADAEDLLGDKMEESTSVPRALNSNMTTSSTGTEGRQGDDGQLPDPAKGFSTGRGLLSTPVSRTTPDAIWLQALARLSQVPQQALETKYQFAHRFPPALAQSALQYFRSWQEQKAQHVGQTASRCS